MSFKEDFEKFEKDLEIGFEKRKTLIKEVSRFEPIISEIVGKRGGLNFSHNEIDIFLEKLNYPEFLKIVRGLCKGIHKLATEEEKKIKVGQLIGEIIAPTMKNNQTSFLARIKTGENSRICLFCNSPSCTFEYEDYEEVVTKRRLISVDCSGIEKEGSLKNEPL